MSDSRGTSDKSDREPGVQVTNMTGNQGNQGNLWKSRHRTRVFMENLDRHMQDTCGKS